MAGVVYETLMNGPYRPEQRFFVFISDNAEANHKIGAKVFKWIQKHCNGDQRYLLSPTSHHLYDLEWLAASQKVL